MDEAERCHRLAILDSGRLVADGTPRELTSSLAGRTLEVHAQQPRRAQQALVGLPGVLSVAQIGNSLRVLMAENGDARSRIDDALRKAGLHAEVAPAEPNLEDVFVSATRGREPQREAA
jgi:ABC-2 type transport system ATP-binding protein